MGIASRRDGSRLMRRIACRIAAVSLALVALLVWLTPGAVWESDVMLFKLAVSSVAGLSSAALFDASQPPLPPTVEIDVARAELRIVREGVEPALRVIERCMFDDLDSVEFVGRRITFWGQGDRLLAEITLSDPEVHERLLSALRKAGKLD